MNWEEEYNYKDYYIFFGAFLFSVFGATCSVLQWEEEPSNRIYNVVYLLVMFPQF